MRLLTGKRIGQSRSELTAAVSFSLFLHAVVFLGALYFSFHFSKRFVVPAAYRVNLVALSANAPVTGPEAPAAAPAPKAAPKPRPAPAPAPKAKHAAIHAAARPAPAPAPKAAMPELPATKQKPVKAAEAPAAPPAPAPSAGTAGKKQPAVALAVAEGGQSFPFAPYVAIVRDKVERNWSPPPGAKGLKARVAFSILRSGRVGDAKLVEASGNFYFDQAAMRAILAASPFPQLPDSFFQDSEAFTVDLMEKE